MRYPSYLIIGCGHFGSRAAEKFLGKDPNSKIIIVDRNKEAVKKVSHLPIETVVGDGPVYLGEFFSKGRSTDYIVPSVPIHLAFEFILSQSKPYGARRTKVPSLSGLPNPVMGKTGDLYTSLSDFLCPEDCPEPSQYCTVTRKKREKPLYDILRELKGPFESRVLVSRPLAIGVGGFEPKGLLGLFGDIRKRKRSGWLFLVSTASRCHGVTSALTLI